MNEVAGQLTVEVWDLGHTLHREYNKSCDQIVLECFVSRETCVLLVAAKPTRKVCLTRHTPPLIVQGTNHLSDTAQMIMLAI